MTHTSGGFISHVYPAFGGITGIDQADGDRFGSRRAIRRIAIYHPTFSDWMSYLAWSHKYLVQYLDTGFLQGPQPGPPGLSPNYLNLDSLDSLGQHPYPPSYLTYRNRAPKLSTI